MAEIWTPNVTANAGRFSAYYAQHTNCPSCDLATVSAGTNYSNLPGRNPVTCLTCDWSGKAFELVPEGSRVDKR